MPDSPAFAKTVREAYTLHVHTGIDGETFSENLHPALPYTAVGDVNLAL
jgi:hypothetical protein